MNSNIQESVSKPTPVQTIINNNECLRTSSLTSCNKNLDLMSTNKTSSKVSSSSSSSTSSLIDCNRNNNGYDEKKGTSPDHRLEDEVKERRQKTSRSPTNQHVAFCNYVDEEPEERRKKYLTAKYGVHQMALIKKRLQVEMWLYEKLQDLSNNQNPYNDDLYDVDLDILLDIEDDQERRAWLENRLAPLYKVHSSDQIVNLIEEIMDRARLL